MCLSYQRLAGDRVSHVEVPAFALAILETMKEKSVKLPPCLDALLCSMKQTVPSTAGPVAAVPNLD